jgi:hypothetical protein
MKGNPEGLLVLLIAIVVVFGGLWVIQRRLGKDIDKKAPRRLGRWLVVKATWVPLHKRLPEKGQWCWTWDGQDVELLRFHEPDKFGWKGIIAWTIPVPPTPPFHPIGEEFQ